MRGSGEAPGKPEGGSMPRAYSITAEAIAEERQRVGDDLTKFDISRLSNATARPV